MQTIATEDIIARIRFENPWWKDEHRAIQSIDGLKPRAYFGLFLPLVKASIRRAVILLGPRRVGKTVMIHHTIQALLQQGISPQSVCYISVDHPIYNGLSVEQLLKYSGEASGTSYTSSSEPVYVVFDEIQYLRNWEVHLKSVVDSYPNIKCIASGSSAAALRLKSSESGAGRFTDFLLPPLTFYEYLLLLDKTSLLVDPLPLASGVDGAGFFSTQDITALNDQFGSYLNFGGYPEVIFSEQIRSDPARFIKSDIIDKVLLRDLPSLYGIGDIQELNYLFTTLAFNTANEISLGELSQNSGAAKNTIKRYIEYLEAAFLIKLVHRVDHNAKRFDRANFFKVYLANPSMRAALFSPMDANDVRIGFLAETAIYSQWFHSPSLLYYARWGDGEVDMVMLGNKQEAIWAVEVKWSDNPCSDPINQLKGVVSFCKANRLKGALVTSRTKTMTCRVDGIDLRFLPTSIYCYTVGYNTIHHKNNPVATAGQQIEGEVKR